MLVDLQSAYVWNGSLLVVMFAERPSFVGFIVGGLLGRSGRPGASRRRVPVRSPAVRSEAAADDAMNGGAGLRRRA